MMVEALSTVPSLGSSPSITRIRNVIQSLSTNVTITIATENSHSISLRPQSRNSRSTSKRHRHRRSLSQLCRLRSHLSMLQPREVNGKTFRITSSPRRPSKIIQLKNNRSQKSRVVILISANSLRSKNTPKTNRSSIRRSLVTKKSCPRTMTRSSRTTRSRLRAAGTPGPSSPSRARRKIQIHPHLC